MRFKKLLLLIIIILFFGFFVYYFKNSKQEVHTTSQENNSNLQTKNENIVVNNETKSSENSNIKQNEITKEEFMKELERSSINAKLEIKTLYNNQENFVKYLQDNSRVKFSNKTNYYFVDNISAVSVSKYDPKKEYLWVDNENIYYKSSTTYQRYDQNKYIVLLEKETNRFMLSNGMYILKYKEPITNTNDFENKFNVKVVSNYSNDKIMIARAKQHTNLLEIYNNLKNVKTLQSIELEVISSYTEPK